VGLLSGLGRFLRLLYAIWRKSRRDRLGGEAARLAYFFFLSIFPFLMVVFALTGILVGEGAFGQVMALLDVVAPPEAARVLARFVRQVTNQTRPDVLSLGLLLYLWAGSNIFTTLSEALDTVYEVKVRRSWLRRRLLSVTLMGSAAGSLALAAVFFMTAPGLLRGIGVPWRWQAASWPLAFALMALLIGLALSLLPSRDQRQSRREVLAGALVGAGLWCAVTLVFRAYVTNVRNYSATYGIVGAAIVMLLWLHLTALTILVSGEVAVALENGRGPRRRRQPARPR
jgi:membrane protein